MAKTIGLTSPSFIVESNGKYYLTLSVLEYDPEKARDDMTLAKGVDQIRNAYNGVATKLGSVEVVMNAQMMNAAQTEPRGVNYISYAQTKYVIEPDD